MLGKEVESGICMTQSLVAAVRLDERGSARDVWLAGVEANTNREREVMYVHVGVLQCR